MDTAVTKRTLKKRALYAYLFASVLFAAIFAVYRPFSAAHLARERALEGVSQEFNRCLATAWQEPLRLAACQTAYDTRLRGVHAASWVRPEYERARSELILAAALIAAAVLLLAWRRSAEDGWEPHEPEF